MKDFMVQIKI